MQNLEIFSLNVIFFVLAFLQKIEQCICSSISFIFVIIDMLIVLKEYLILSDLFEAQSFYIYKTIKVVVIYKNKDLVLITF